MTKIVDVSKWTMKFGKYKGKTFKDLIDEEPKYCKWLLEKRIFDTDDEKYMKSNTSIIKFLQDNL